MADYGAFMETLKQLNPYEALGRELSVASAYHLNHKQYLFLLRTKLSKPRLEDLYTPDAIERQEQIAREFHEKYGEYGLTERDFMLTENNVETEQLPRYIDIPAHSHEFAECACVLRGQCRHKIEEAVYIQDEGSFTLIPPLVRHELIAVENSICFTIKIRPMFFIKMSIPHLPLFIYPLSFQCGQDPAFESMLLFLYQQQQSTLEFRTQLIENTLTNLITYIIQNYKDTRRFLFDKPIQDKKMLEIVNYTYENYQTVTLQTVAEHFHYNQTYLSRMFHEKAGQSFSLVLKEFKLRKAADLLITKPWKIEYVCGAVGYKDSRQFIRSFKEMFGMTPIQYRKNNRMLSP